MPNTSIIKLEPGTPAARKFGCTCSAIQEGVKADSPIDPKCPVHGLPVEARERPEPLPCSLYVESA